MSKVRLSHIPKYSQTFEKVLTIGILITFINFKLFQDRISIHFQFTARSTNSKQTLILRDPHVYKYTLLYGNKKIIDIPQGSISVYYYF